MVHIRYSDGERTRVLVWSGATDTAFLNASAQVGGWWTAIDNRTRIRLKLNAQNVRGDMHSHQRNGVPHGKKRTQEQI
jgi:hypothetical protein